MRKHPVLFVTLLCAFWPPRCELSPALAQMTGNPCNLNTGILMLTPGMGQGTTTRYWNARVDDDTLIHRVDHSAIPKIKKKVKTQGPFHPSMS